MRVHGGFDAVGCFVRGARPLFGRLRSGRRGCWQFTEARLEHGQLAPLAPVSVSCSDPRQGSRIELEPYRVQ